MIKFYVAPLLKPVKFSKNDYLYKCQDMIDEMYFVAKGTVIFCLDKRYGEKEIREIKKNNNFGEIEMCLNEKLSFNIKIKSRNCELFVLKKNDFLRLSVNFKEFIESFLHKSLMKYLKFNEEKNQMIKEFDSLINGEEGDDDEDDEDEEEEEDEEEGEENEEGDKALESIDEVGGSSSEGESNEDEDYDDNKKKEDKSLNQQSKKSLKSKKEEKEKSDSESQKSSSSSGSGSSSNKTKEMNENNSGDDKNDKDKDKEKNSEGDSTYRAE